MGLMLNCKEATLLIEKKQEETIKVGDRMKLAFHLTLCKVCVIYEKQSKLIEAILKKKTTTEPNSNNIIQLKKEIKEKIGSK